MPGKGSLIDVMFTYDVEGSSAASDATKVYNGYFLGVYYKPSQADFGTDITVKAHGVDLLNGGGTNAGNVAAHLPAVVDIGGTSIQASLGIPFKGALTIATAGGATDDNGVIHAYIRLAGNG